MNHKNLTIKNVLFVIIAVIVGLFFLSLLGNLMWTIVKFLIPCAIIYAVLKWLGDRNSYRRR